MMKKIIYWIKKNYLILLPILLLIIFIVSIWNSGFPIGGDNVLPLNPLSNIEKSIYVWEDWNQGISQWRYTSFLWQAPFYLFSFLGLPILVGIKITMSSYLVIGFIFTYLFFRTLFKGTKYDRLELGIFCGFIFTLNAATLLVLPTTIYLQALPLCAYLVIKYLDTNRIRYAIFFSLTVSYAYFRHLPQARYLIITLGVLFFVLLLYKQSFSSNKQLRNINLKQIVLKLFVLAFFTFLLNAYLLMPFIYEAFKLGGTFSYYTQNVTVYNGEADLNTATLSNIGRFFTSSLVVPGARFGGFFLNPFFTIWTYILWIMAIVSVFFLRNKKEKRLVFLLFLGCLFFILVAKGANPPFGMIYKFLLFNLPVFKMFRTTADTIIGATLFFSLLLTISVYYFTKGRRNLFTLILLIHIFIFSPIYLGYRLITSEENGEVKKGHFIPPEYYQMGKNLNGIKEDVKILSLPLDDGYSYKDWFYTGQPIMAWMTKKPFIHGQIAGFPGATDNLVLQRMSPSESCYWTAINNIGYILKEKDSRRQEYSFSKFNFLSFPILENSYFRLERVNKECFLPSLYVSSGIFAFDGKNNNLPGAVRFIKNKQDIIITLNNSINKQSFSAGKKKNSQIASQIIEAYPKELNNLSDNVFTKKMYSIVSSWEPLNFWTYSFTAPEEKNYQMVIDREGAVSQEPILLKKGENVIKIPVSKSPNLIDESLLMADKESVNFSQVIKDWQIDNLYLLSLEYKTKTAGKIFLNVDERERHHPGRLPFYEFNSTLFSQEINQSQAGTYQYQVILRAEISAQTAAITLKKLSGNISVESFKMEKIIPPKVFFTSLNDDEEKIVPKMTFHKINPTKYTVEIKNSVRPYYLILSNSFSTDWKVYLQTDKTTPFWEWFKKPIAKNQHLMVNGFANGWEIRPEDSWGKTNYSIVVEYWPQRLFYIGAIISGLMVVFCMVLGIIHKVKKNINE